MSKEINSENAEVISIVVSPEESGMRLDAFIGAKLSEVSRSYAAQLIEQGCVVIRKDDANGDSAFATETSKKKKVQAGDVIELELPEPTSLDITPEDIPLDIVYEDDDVIVVNKSRGMVVHPSVGNWNGTLVNAIMYHCGNSLSSINGVVRPGIVHRIDKDTSGLLMIAKNDMAHESLAEQLKIHSVTREYTALVYDNLKEDEVTINEPIGRDERNRLRRAVWGSGHKEAVTHIHVVTRYGKYTLVKAKLETGRTHQIRVHMAYIKHPLVGDELYGPKNQPEKFMGVELKGQFLHAGTLGFEHPRTGEYMEFHSDLPESLEQILKKLNRENALDNLAGAAADLGPLSDTEIKEGRLERK